MKRLPRENDALSWPAFGSATAETVGQGFDRFLLYCNEKMSSSWFQRLQGTRGPMSLVQIDRSLIQFWSSTPSMVTTFG